MIIASMLKSEVVIERFGILGNIISMFIYYIRFVCLFVIFVRYLFVTNIL